MSDADLKLRLVVQLLKRAIEMEANEADVTFRAYLVEEDRTRKKVIFQVYKESELHRIILEDLIHFLGETPRNQAVFKEYDFEDMFGDQRLHVLMKVETMARDLYIDILQELEKTYKDAHDERLAKIIRTVSKLLEWEDKHISMVESIARF